MPEVYVQDNLSGFQTLHNCRLGVAIGFEFEERPLQVTLKDYSWRLDPIYGIINRLFLIDIWRVIQSNGSIILYPPYGGIQGWMMTIIKVDTRPPINSYRSDSDTKGQVNTPKFYIVCYKY